MERFKARFEAQPEEEYHAVEAISAHGLKALVRSPLHYYSQFILKEEKESKARRFGTLAHLYLLERERFNAMKAIEPSVDKRTKTGKQEYENWLATVPEGAIIFKQQEYLELVRMLENIQQHPVASNLLSNGAAELSGFWTDFDTGLPCKMRPDFLPHEPAIVDIKTCSDASYKAFQKAIVNYRYDIQVAHYLDGYCVINGIERDSIPFVFIAIENQPPYAVAVYVASQEIIDSGRKAKALGIQRYLVGKQTTVWAGYQTEAEEMTLPVWFKEQ